MHKHFHHDDSSFGKGLGIGLISAIASAAATYYLYGTEEGAEKREQIKGFMKDAKNKAVETGDDIKVATAEVYNNMKEVLKDKYDDLSQLSKDEKMELAKKIKNRWENVRDDIDEALAKATAKPGKVK
ncbi:MAG: hypothetical protein WCV79_00200 [Candidatus Paceibacterota bacterium]